MIMDSKDPSGMGMYSKRGRFTNELYAVFRRKEEILHNKPRYLKVASFPTIDLNAEEDFNEINRRNMLKFEEEHKRHVLIGKQESVIKEPWDKIVSREDHFISKLKPDEVPSSTKYKPKGVYKYFNFSLIIGKAHVP